MRKINNIIAGAILMNAIVTMSSCAGPGLEEGIGLQLYSLRDDMTKDVVTTVQKVGEMGYDFVEAAGYSDGKFYIMRPADFKTLVEENGMVFKGSHTGQAIPDSASWETLMPWWDKAIAAHKAAGVKYIVQPFMGKSGYESLAGLSDYCAYFNAVGEKCNEAGIRFGYHNHAHEFEELEGEVIYDYMLENTDPEKVMFQLDIYWILEGKGDPKAYFEKYPGRFLSFHLKDEKELGESGKIDFKEIFKLKEEAGALYHVVEVERYSHEPLESVKLSLDYLKEINYTK